MIDGEDIKIESKHKIGGVAETSLSLKGKSLPSPSALPILKGFLMSDKGTYIYLFRRVRKTSFYKDSYALHLAIHCLIKANRFPNEITLGNQIIKVDIGQFVSGRHVLHLETGIKESTIRNKLTLLKKARFLDIKATTKYSIITVLNYINYQIKLEDRTAGQPTEQPTENHNKESKEYKKEKNNICAFPFKDIWERYPKKLGRKSAERHFTASVKSEEDFKNIGTALNNYLKSERVAKGFVQNGATWFCNWADWITFTEELCSKCKGKGKYSSPTGYEVRCTCPAGVREK